MAGLAGGLAVTVVSAADDNKIIYPKGPGREEAVAAGGSGAFNQLTLVLGVALAGVGAWLVWRNRRGPVSSREVRRLGLEETRSLGNRQYLVVASYEGKKFLLGVCPGSISLLTALPPAKSSGDDQP